jgi:MFS family permease
MRNTAFPQVTDIRLIPQFKDVGIVQNQFNIGQQMLSLGIVLFELPSNLLLYRVGPGRWLSSQVVAFGLVSTFQAFQKNYASFIVTRLLLGLTESGYIPGALYTLSTWCELLRQPRRLLLADTD